MAIFIGLDIGAIATKLAALGEAGDSAVLRRLCEGRNTFRFLSHGMAGDGSGPVVLSRYRRIAGSPARAAFGLLQEFYQAVPENLVNQITVTGSGGGPVAELLGVPLESEFKAISRMMAAWYPEIRTVFEIGGRTFKYIPLERPDDGQTTAAEYDSGGCEVGMGIFLEQQAARMRVPMEAMGEAACSAGQAPRISSGCSVFIKSDMIHAQQKGYMSGEVLRGLCEAVATKFKNIAVKGRPVTPLVALIGAVSQNAGVARALRETFQLKIGELIIPELYAWCGAIGAAMAEPGDPREQVTFAAISRLVLHEAPTPPDAVPPLSMGRVTRVCEGMTSYVWPSGTGCVPAYLGIDVGSVSTKLAVIDEEGTLIHDAYLPTAGKPVETAGLALEEVARLCGDRLDIRGVGTTGSGRELVAAVFGADAVRDEITAHKTGALYVSRDLGSEPPDTIFEIGGQDSKYTFLENGVVTDFAMNGACAAGTGSFLEEQAETLGIDIKGEFASLALSAPAPARLEEVCTVGTGNDLIARMQKGETIPNLLAGLAAAIARNYVDLVIGRRPVGNVVYFQGGTASNDAVAAALAGLTGRNITVPPHNGVIGAIGAALLARQWRRETRAKTKFRGYHLKEIPRATRDFTCRGCNNHCDLKEITIDGDKSYWGSKCSDRYARPAVTERRPVIEDLFAYREELFDEITASGIESGKLTIGLSRALTHFDLYPFWHRYLTHLGMTVALSPPTDPGIAEAGQGIVQAPFCRPVRVALGHVKILTETEADYILLPAIDRTGVEDGGGECCLWTGMLPYIVGSTATLKQHRTRFLVPSVSFGEGRESVKAGLFESVERLGISRSESDRAADAAYAAQKAFKERLLTSGRSALARLEATGEPGVLVLGRSYNIYDRNINCDVPRKLRAHYGANVIPFDFLVPDKEPQGEPWDGMIWESSRKILQAAKLAASRKDLHLIYNSCVLCGPDAATRQAARRVAGSPLLLLQFDGLGYDAGYMTRCEAYLDSKGILSCYEGQGKSGKAAGEC